MEEIFTRAKQAVVTFYDSNPCIRHMKIHLVEVEYGRSRMRMYVDPNIQANVYHYAHGGALMTAADSAMGAACLSTNKKVVTLEFNMNCIKPVLEGMEIFAEGKVLHGGSKTIVAECELLDKDGVLYGKARASFFIVGAFVE